MLSFLPSVFSGGRDDLILGRTGPYSFFPTYRVPGRARSAHMYVIGITGKGKSKLLENCIVQDILAGKGCVLLDPHSDLASDVMRHILTAEISKSRLVDRLVYFDPTRSDYIVPFNVLSGDTDSYQIAQRVVEAFRRTWPDSLAEAPHFSNVATAALITLAENKLTLIEMHRILTDQEFRDGLLRNVTNPEIVNFFHDRYDRWGREAPLLRESTLNKVSAFTFNPYLRRVLGQKENSLDLRRIMDEGKILIVDLGRADGETRKLIGSLLVTGLEQAAASRHDLPPEKRLPCYAYIDEFQDFAASSGSAKTLAQILSECRKFGLHLTLAHQSLSQLSERMLGAIGNIQTRVIFGVSRSDAEFFARDVGRVDIEAIKHDAQTETQHPLFEPITNQWETWTETIKYQPSRRAVVSGYNGKVSQIWTMAIPRYTVSPNEIDKLKLDSLRRWGIKCSTQPTTYSKEDQNTVQHIEPMFSL